MLDHPVKDFMAKKLQSQLKDTDQFFNIFFIELAILHRTGSWHLTQNQN